MPPLSHGALARRQRHNGCVSNATQNWQPDELGPAFEQLTLDLGSDVEGLVVATLVRYLPEPARRSFFTRWRKEPQPQAENTDVLYVHGWSDYFFQTHLAEYWRRQGARFYALDLRKYGRSLRAGQSPGYVEDLDTYDEDIEAALSAIGHGKADKPTRKLVLMGHSTGGLILSLWLARHGDRANALILNSPWLEYQLTSTLRQVVEPVMGLQAKVAPRSRQVNPDLGFYNRTISKKKGGEWEFNEAWRPERAWPVRTAWLKAVLAGHTQVAGGLGIKVPILTLLSDRSMLTGRWSEKMREADVVIDVETTAVRAPKLGRRVTVIRIPHAMHDIVLSNKRARSTAFLEITRWIGSYL
jgi:alpha-beta hydrolase superfamily lysophospholipase